MFDAGHRPVHLCGHGSAANSRASGDFLEIIQAAVNDADKKAALEKKLKKKK